MFLLFVAWATQALAQVAKITRFRYSALPTTTRLVFETTGPVSYTTNVFPKKIIVDIKQAKAVAMLNKQGIAETPISSIISSQIKIICIWF